MKSKKTKAVDKQVTNDDLYIESGCESIDLAEELKEVFTTPTVCGVGRCSDTPTWEEFSGGCNMPYDAIVKERFRDWRRKCFTLRYQNLRNRWYKFLYNLFFKP